MVERNELLPRVSELIYPLVQEELEKIPRDRLEAKAAEGIRKHKILEDNYGKPNNNLLSYMFAEGLKKIFTAKKLKQKPRIEEQLNGKRFTGKPDYCLLNTIADYKFTDELRDPTALQLIKYGVLELEVNKIDIKRYYAFHFPNDYSLFIHKIPERSIEPLKEYAGFILDNHEAIREGDLEKYEALSKWKKMLQDYDMFEPVAVIFPPLTITDAEKADIATMIYCKMKAIKEYEAKLNSELKRYMQEKEIPRIGDEYTGGVRLQVNNKKVYDKKRQAVAKKAYNKALKDCQIDTEQTISLVRFEPTRKEIKLITKEEL